MKTQMMDTPLLSGANVKGLPRIDYKGKKVFWKT